jgi:hypothetical protein
VRAKQVGPCEANYLHHPRRVVVWDADVSTIQPLLVYAVAGRIQFFEDMCLDDIVLNDPVGAAHGALIRCLTTLLGFPPHDAVVVEVGTTRLGAMRELLCADFDWFVADSALGLLVRL